MVLFSKERQVRHCQSYNSALHSGDSGKITILSLVEDVTERVAALEDVYRLAHHDTLTGLPEPAADALFVTAWAKRWPPPAGMGRAWR